MYVEIKGVKVRIPPNGGNGSAMQPYSSARITLRTGALVGMKRTKRAVNGSDNFTRIGFLASWPFFGPFSSCNRKTTRIRLHADVTWPQRFKLFPQVLMVSLTKIVSANA